MAVGSLIQCGGLQVGNPRLEGLQSFLHTQSILFSQHNPGRTDVPKNSDEDAICPSFF
jgi:hypothetical protein